MSVRPSVGWSVGPSVGNAFVQIDEKWPFTVQSDLDNAVRGIKRDEEEGGTRRDEEGRGGRRDEEGRGGRRDEEERGGGSDDASS